MSQIVDINNDGSVDLLVSINSNVEGRLVVYEILGDFRFDFVVLRKFFTRLPRPLEPIFASVRGFLSANKRDG